jgi:hypothetical protein
MQRPHRLLLALALSSPTLAHADGAMVKQGPGGVFPLKSADVEMVEETIDVTLARDGLLAPDNVALVSVSYRFRNHAKHAVALDMGFPIAWDTSEFYAQGQRCFDRGTASAVSDFAVTIDGAAVTAVRKPGQPGIRTGCLDDDTAMAAREREAKVRERGPWYNEFFVWPVAFDAGAEHTIVNRYRYDARTTSRGGDWTELQYVLRTGGLWRGGVIGQVAINVHFGDRARVGFDPPAMEAPERFDDDPFVFKADLTKVKPDGAVVRRTPDGKTELTWRLTKLKPEANLAFAYATAGQARAAIRELISAAIKKPLPPRTLALARDTLDALHGRTFTDPALQKRFAAKGWYLTDPDWQRHAAADPLVAKVAALAPR